MECSLNSPALPLLMKHLVIGQRLKTPNFSAFHWSGFHWSAFRSHEGITFIEKYRSSLISESDQSGLNHQLLQLCTARIAWSDSDQAVRAVHGCNSWFFPLTQ